MRCRRGRDGPMKREKVVAEVMKARKTQCVYRAQQREA
jgi:hypothetical protein